MKSLEKMPKAENIPALNINNEGLKRHSLLSIFVPEPTLSADDRKLRSWLLHTLTTAARHYTKARELVALQDSADQVKDGGMIFYVFDVSEHIEGCVTAMYRLCMAIKRMSSAAIPVDEFCQEFEKYFSALCSIRNQFEHMHSQIVASETGSGPISIAFGDDGRSIRFRKLKMETAHLHILVEGAYKLISGMYPTFNVDSAPEPIGHAKLTMTATVTFIDENSDLQELGK